MPVSLPMPIPKSTNRFYGLQTAWNQIQAKLQELTANVAGRQNYCSSSKTEFSVEYFYEECANTIKIQIWVTLFVNLLLMIIKKKLIRSWSFFGLTIMILLFCGFYNQFSYPEKIWEHSWAQIGKKIINYLSFDGGLE